MVEPLRHRQTKGAETDMFDLQLPRHISTLPWAPLAAEREHVGNQGKSGRGPGAGNVVNDSDPDMSG
jgi:hypothetical protein